MNSLTGATHVELWAALDAAAADPAVRALVITGDGRGFCAGQDLGNPAMVASGQDANGLDVCAVVERVYRPLGKPGAVYARAGHRGRERRGRGRWSEPRAALRSGGGQTQCELHPGLQQDRSGTRLPGALGCCLVWGGVRAEGLAMTGEKLPAEEAQRMDLIWQCVDDAEFEAAVAQLALRLAAMPSQALVQTGLALDAAAPISFSDASTLEAQTQRTLGRAHDSCKGLAAFFSRRKPRFAER